MRVFLCATSTITFPLLFVFLQLQTEIVLAQSAIELYNENNKVGARDQLGNVIIPAAYRQIGWSKGLNIPVGGAIGYNGMGWGLISLKNKIITGPRYYSLEAHHKNLIVASIKSKFSGEILYGVINSKGKVIVGFRYDSISPLHDLIIVSERGEGKSYYGLLGQQGQPLLPLAFENISYFKDDLFVFTALNKKKGIVNKNGVIKIEASLDSIAPASESYSLIFESGKVGAIDSLGQIVHEPLFKSIVSAQQAESFRYYQIFDASHRRLNDFYCDSIFELSKDLLAVVRNGFYEILDNKFDIVYCGQALEKLSAFRKNILFKKKDKSHIIKFNGEPVNSNGFDTLQFDQTYIYAQTGGQWQVFNKFGSNISDRGFDSLIIGSNNLVPVKRNGYWGYIDHAGKIAIPIKFDSVGAFVGNMAQVNYLGARRIINQFGGFIGESDYSHVTIKKANTALVTKYGRTDLINYRGEILFQTFNRLSPNFFGYRESTGEGKVGLVSHLGEIILYPEYDSISAPKNRRYVAVKQGDKTGLANFKGFWVLPLSQKTQEICHISDGLISIKRNGQYGYVDFGQKLIIANRYEKTKPFTSDLAAVKLNDKWGFIDKKEKLVIHPTYTNVTSFRNGVSLVSRGGKYGAIDPDGLEKIRIEFDSVSIITDDFFLARKDSRLGLFDQHGELLLQPSYTGIRPTLDGYFVVERRGFSGIIDTTGGYSIPLKYLSILEISNGRYICLEKETRELE